MTKRYFSVKIRAYLYKKVPGSPACKPPFLTYILIGDRAKAFYAHYA